MKILYISHSNAKGGSNMALASVIRGMMQRGHEVFVVTTREEGYFLQELDRMGVAYCQVDTAMTIYPLNHNALLYLPRIAVMLYRQHRGIKATVEAIRRFNPDIVHTNVGPLAIGYEACKRTGIPHIWHQRELMDEAGFHFFPSFSSFKKKSHSAGNYNICITQNVFNHWNFNPNKDRVIYDGVFSKNITLPEDVTLPVAEDSTLPVADREQRKNVLYVGRIEEGKGVFDVLSSFRIFHQRHPEYTLQLIGDTPTDSLPFEEKCRRYVEEQALQESISFLGRRDDVYRFMSSAAMLVMPSYSEGFGFVTAEAMACGCPVIGRNTTGTKEQLDNGLSRWGKEIGFRFSDNKEMLEAMEKVLATDTTEMCRRARQTVFDLYTIERNVEEIEKYYKEILSAKPNF